MTPHYYRRSAIHTVLLFLISLIIATVIFSCSPQKGCSGTRGMSGYGWMKCRETKKVFVLDKDGAIVCTYIDNN
jgi:hypothetical protein